MEFVGGAGFEIEEEVSPGGASVIEQSIFHVILQCCFESKLLLLRVYQVGQPPGRHGLLTVKGACCALADAGSIENKHRMNDKYELHG